MDFWNRFFLGSMHWIIFPFLVYEKHYFLAPIIFIIFPSFLGLFFAIPSTLIFWFSKYIDNRFIFLKSFIISFFFFFSNCFAQIYLEDYHLIYFLTYGHLIVSL